jgi:hypothetical protein
MKKYFLLVIGINLSFADSFLFHLKNDFINDTDRHLTNSMKFSWMFENKKNDYFDSFNFLIQHDIYTPDNIKSKNIADYDMPYAGYIKTEYNFYRFTNNYYHSLGFILGYIGEKTYAKELQDTLHTLIDANDPQGWDNQIGSKGIYGISYDFGHRVYKKELEIGKIDFSYNFHTELSSAKRDFLTILSFRYGNNYPNNFINPQINLTKTKGWDLSFNIYYDYMDYFYITDEYEQQYNINRDETLTGGSIKFNLYRDDSIYSLNFEHMNIHLQKREHDRWFGISYTYIF